MPGDEHALIQPTSEVQKSQRAGGAGAAEGVANWERISVVLRCESKPNVIMKIL